MHLSNISQRVASGIFPHLFINTDHLVQLKVPTCLDFNIMLIIPYICNVCVENLNSIAAVLFLIFIGETSHT